MRSYLWNIIYDPYPTSHVMYLGVAHMIILPNRLEEAGFALF